MGMDKNGEDYEARSSCVLKGIKKIRTLLDTLKMRNSN